jgi:potassium efflux system protein
MSVSANSRVAAQRLNCGLVLCLLCFFPFLVRPAWGQESSTGVSVSDQASPVTAEGVQAQLDRTNADATLDETLKSKLVPLYTQALEQLRSSKEWADKAAQFEAEAAAAPDEIQANEKKRRQPPATPEAPEETTAGLEQRLAQIESELVAARQDRDALKEEGAQRAERRKQLPELLTSARQRLAELPPASPAVTETTEPPQLVEAGRVLAVAQKQALEYEIRAYEVQLQTYEIRGQLREVRLEQAIRKVAQLEESEKVLRRAVGERRQEEAREAVRETQRALLETAHATPRVRNAAEELAEANAALAARRTGPNGLLMKVDSTSAELAQVQAQLAALRDQSKSIRQKVEAAGLTNAIGLLLRRQMTELPDARAHRRNVRARRQVTAQVQFEQIELGEQRSAVADVESLLQHMLSVAGISPEAEQRATIESLFRELLQSQKDTLDALYADYDRYFEELVDLDSSEQRLIEESEQLAAYIDEHILWIVSGSVLGLGEFKGAWAAVAWLFSARQWAEVPRASWADLRGVPFLYLLALVVLGGLFWARRRSAGWLRHLSEQASGASCTSYRVTLQALSATFIRAAFVPALIGYLGWRFATNPSGTAFVGGVGTALRDVALVVLSFFVLRETALPAGLAEVHFGWPAAPTAVLRRHVGWLLAATAPCLFVVSLTHEWGDEAWRESLGRLVFMANLVAAAVFAHKLMHPTKGDARRIRDLTHPGGRSRWHYVWYVVSLLAPLSLFVLAWRGYFYTAFRLGTRLYGTACLLLAVFLIRAMILRWLLIVRRCLAMENERQRRESERVASSGATEEQADAKKAGVDLAKLDAQTYRLVQSFVVVAMVLGMWFIWAKELPALGVLERVELWDNTKVVSEVFTGADGVKSVQTREAPAPISLADLALAVVIGVLTFLLTVDVPGLVEVIVLKRLNLGTGERFAITTLIRYAITLIGVVLVFKTLGVGWAKLQWLVAAVGLGLGFGLQEIFANFISGLILLFERPIRVGDTVTVGGVSGQVSRIRMRATWITDFDRKELVVPNKEFVTGQLVNWTLTDPVIRIIIPVGIAYGSNTVLVEKILYEVAEKNPFVLKDPPPIVLFKEFGESSLNFELRAYCADVNLYLDAQHSLHMAIDGAFREAGIRIAFPQRDIHIRSVSDGFPLPDKDGGKRL